jgi:hypothetical protein
MAQSDESIAVASLHRSNNSVDTLEKLKEKVPSLEKYISPQGREETFSEIYHWLFSALKGNPNKKVVELEAHPVPAY